MAVNLEMAERLRDARRMAGYNSAADAAQAIGIGYSTYSAVENGNRGFARHAPRFAKFYSVNLTWLMTGVGKPREDDPKVESIDAMLNSAPENIRKMVRDIVRIIVMESYQTAPSNHFDSAIAAIDATIEELDAMIASQRTRQRCSNARNVDRALLKRRGAIDRR